MVDRITRKAKETSKPMLVLTIDEHTGEAGFVTRLEAFIDMLYRKKRSKIIDNINVGDYDYVPQTNICNNVLAENGQG
jgi:predicted nucleotide-binding protein (sugar kinase/HSP70/actin superfamily)